MVEDEGGGGSITDVHFLRTFSDRHQVSERTPPIRDLRGKQSIVFRVSESNRRKGRRVQPRHIRGKGGINKKF